MIVAVVAAIFVVVRRSRPLSVVALRRGLVFGVDDDGFGVWPLNYFHHVSGVTLLHALHAIPTNSSLPMDAP